jgi:TolB-like protein
MPVLILVLSLPALAQKPPESVATRDNVAVLQMENRCRLVKDSEAEFLTDLLRKAAAEHLDPARFAVMTRETMDVLLPPSEIRCLSGECLAKIGQRLQARFVVGGSLKDVGSRIGITLEAYESATGMLKGSETGTAKDMDEAVTFTGQASQKLLGRLSGGIGGAAAPGPAGTGTVLTGVSFDRGEHIVNAVTDSTGFLVITTDPPGAAISVNGKEAGTAPVQLERPVGRYVVVAELGKLYHPARQEVALTAAGSRVTLVLAPAFGRLQVESEPPGAEVSVDGEPVGITPWRAERKASGPHVVRLVKPCFLVHESTVTVTDGQTALHRVQLVPNAGGLRVESEPPGAAVSIDGTATGRTTPAVVEPLQPGVVVVKLTLPGYGDFADRATIRNHETATISAKLVPKLGLLVVTAANEQGVPCEGEVLLDGKASGRTPFKSEVLAVRHAIEVRCAEGSGIAYAEVEHNRRADVAIRVGQKAPDPPKPSKEGKAKPATPKRLGFNAAFLAGYGTPDFLPGVPTGFAYGASFVLTWDVLPLLGIGLGADIIRFKESDKDDPWVYTIPMYVVVQSRILPDSAVTPVVRTEFGGGVWSVKSGSGHLDKQTYGRMFVGAAAGVEWVLAGGLGPYATVHYRIPNLLKKATGEEFVHLFGGELGMVARF